jgi:hypothetical protein
LENSQINSATLKHYLNNISPTRIYFLVGKGQPFVGLDEETIRSLRALGLEAEFNPGTNQSYAAIFGRPAGGKGLEILSPDPIEVNLKIGQKVNQFNLPFDVVLMSAGLQTGNYASLTINDKQYSYNKPGINLISYDTLTGEIRAEAFTRSYQVTCP